MSPESFTTVIRIKDMCSALHGLIERCPLEKQPALHVSVDCIWEDANSLQKELHEERVFEK